MKIVAVIPARMGSTRFPGKPLAVLAGRPMVEWVYRAVCEARVPTDVFIATPDAEIADVAKSFGATVVMTRHDHATGTDRIAEATEKIGADGYVNVQGDEPLVPPVAVDACARMLLEGAEMSSVYCWAQESEYDDPAVVKVVTDLQDRALYFSRSQIPYPRGAAVAPVKKHMGIYGYTAGVLSRFSSWQPTPLEKTEMLEQLRFMEHGIVIQMACTEGSPIAVDTPEQAKIASDLLAREVLK